MRQVTTKNVKTAWKRSESTLPLRAWARSYVGRAWLCSFTEKLAAKWGDKWINVLERNENSGELTPKCAKITGHN